MESGSLPGASRFILGASPRRATSKGCGTAWDISKSPRGISPSCEVSWRVNLLAVLTVRWRRAETASSCSPAGPLTSYCSHGTLRMSPISWCSPSWERAMRPPPWRCRWAQSIGSPCCCAQAPTQRCCPIRLSRSLDLEHLAGMLPLHWRKVVSPVSASLTATCCCLRTSCGTLEAIFLSERQRLALRVSVG